MGYLWTGRTKKQLEAAADALNSSAAMDENIFTDDVDGSIAHATMLREQGIISPEDSKQITDGLKRIAKSAADGLAIADAEDVHSFVEAKLTEDIGEAGGRLHTARSRNDQVALDLRLYTLRKVKTIKSLLIELEKVIADVAAKHTKSVMSGYTHLQRAQPVTLAHHLLAYGEMFKRDFERLCDSEKRTAVSPLGSCALAGTTFPIDRERTAELLGMNGACSNSMDGVGDRDFVIETVSAISLIAMHLSRLSEELILWSSQEFGYVTLDDAFTTGSSIMPQKKNSDIAELVRSKTGRINGDLICALTVMKGLPLAYNKDMQETKEPLFDAVDTIVLCLSAFAPMLATAKFHTDVMRGGAQKGFINATDCADYLTKKGMPFRKAYKLIGELVADCIEKGVSLEQLTIEQLQNYSPLFESDVYDALDMNACVERRISDGAPSTSAVAKQLSAITAFIAANSAD